MVIGSDCVWWLVVVVVVLAVEMMDGVWSWCLVVFGSGSGSGGASGGEG